MEIAWRLRGDVRHKSTRWMFVVAAIASASVWAAACSDLQQASRATEGHSDAVSAASPALADYGERIIEGELWQRPGLSPRDRSVVTVAVLIARNQAIAAPAQFGRALDNGVTPAEILEMIRSRHHHYPSIAILSPGRTTNS